MLTGIDINSVRFGEPHFLWLLVVPAALLVIWVWQFGARRRDARRFRQHRRLPVRERFPVLGGLVFWLVGKLVGNGNLLYCRRVSTISSAVIPAAAAFHNDSGVSR